MRIFFVFFFICFWSCFSLAKVRRIYEIKKEMHKHLSLSEPLARLELATYALRMRCSTNWAIAATAFCFTGCKFTAFFETTKRKEDFFEKIFLKAIFEVCSVIFLLKKLFYQYKKYIFAKVYINLRSDNNYEPKSLL